MASQTERHLTAQIAAHESWARTEDRSARTAAGRAGFLARFDLQVDPDGKLTTAERTRRAEHLRKAYFKRLALKSAKARAAQKVVDAGEAADVELAALEAVFSGDAA